MYKVICLIVMLNFFCGCRDLRDAAIVYHVQECNNDFAFPKAFNVDNVELLLASEVKRNENYNIVYTYKKGDGLNTIRVSNNSRLAALEFIFNCEQKSLMLPLLLPPACMEGEKKCRKKIADITKENMHVISKIVSELQKNSNFKLLSSSKIYIFNRRVNFLNYPEHLRDTDNKIVHFEELDLTK